MLLQIAALPLMPALFGLSLSRSLRNSPSRFSCVTLYMVLRRLRLLDALWLTAALSWLAYSASVFASAGGPLTLHYVVATVLIASVLTQLWTQLVLVRQLGAIDERYSAPGQVVIALAADGYFECRGRKTDRSLRCAGAAHGIVIHATLSVLVLAVLAMLAGQLGAFDNVVVATKLTVLVGFWFALRVLLMDLSLDTWPGTAGRARLRRTCQYYVQIFEQWVVISVLVGLTVVMLVAPIGVVMGYLPPISASFAVWAGLSIVYAVAWNTLLFKRGRVASFLPFPMQKNRYSGTRPLWAYFVTVLHIGMVVCLIVSLMVMQGGLIGAAVVQP
jgi:hypothetical protein